MNLEKELKKINEYFSKLSTEEFEKILERNGINEIKSIAENGYELLCESDYSSEIIYEFHKNKIKTDDDNWLNYECNNIYLGAA